MLFDWAYEHPILILAAALLVPGYPLVPLAGRVRERALYCVLPAFAFILSFATDAASDAADLGDGDAWSASIVVSLIALACLGRRWAFAASLPL